MLKKTITYNDLDGNPLTEDFYFNLSKAEIAEWRLRAIKNGEDSLDEMLKKISAAEDGAVIIDTFKDILTKAVGRRSDDGKRFIKNQDITDEFMQSDAYSVLFMEILTDAPKAAQFINAILPADLVEKASAGETLVSLPKEMVPAEVPNPIVLPKEDVKFEGKPIENYTHEELVAMPDVEFKTLLAKHKNNAPRHLLVAGMQRLSNQ